MEFPTKKHLRNGVLSAARKELCGEYSEHSHEFFEIEYMIDGSGQYVVDDVSYPIRKGALFFMTPVSFHRVATPGAEIFNVMFSFDLCDTEMLLDRFANHTAVIAQLSPEDQRLVESLMTEMTATTHLPYAIQCLRCLIYKLTFLDQEQAALSPHVRRAVAYLLEHFREPISRQAMAREVGLAPAYFSDLFSREVGIPFKPYLDRLRLDYAAKLLSFTELSATEVSEQAGFGDYSVFYRCFKKRFGVSPGQFGSRNRKKL